MPISARFAVMLLVLLGWSGSAWAGLLPDHCAILPISQGSRAVAQCSRDAPTHVTGFWEPSPSQVLAIEKRLPGLLSRRAHAPKLSGCLRQYVGVVTNGKKIIYLNAIPASAPAFLKRGLSWKASAIIVCDGGGGFWGVEFDPADNTFRNLAFNGEG